MTLTVTSYAADANSYATLAEAEAYMTRYQAVDKLVWAAATDSAKESALIGAAMALDVLDWKGTRVTVTQSLQWPRAGVMDRDGWSVDGLIPGELRRAQCELAFRMLQSDRLKDAGALVPGSMSVGSLNLSGIPDPKTIPGPVRQMIAHFLRSGSGLCAPLVRA